MVVISAAALQKVSQESLPAHEEAAEAIAEGDAPPAAVSFASVGELRKILTERRIGLLQTLMNTDAIAESISALTEVPGRDYRTVHDDVTLLAN